MTNISLQFLGYCHIQSLVLQVILLDFVNVINLLVFGNLQNFTQLKNQSDPVHGEHGRSFEIILLIISMSKVRFDF